MKNFSHFTTNMLELNARLFYCLIASAFMSINMSSWRLKQRVLNSTYRFLKPHVHTYCGFRQRCVWPTAVQMDHDCKKNTRENPRKCKGKENFTEKLNEALWQFYKPRAAINAFKYLCIFTVNSTAVTWGMLTSSHPYTNDASYCEKNTHNVKQSTGEQRMAKCAF